MIPITILMPVYNAEKYLKEAIESVLSQTYENFELLIINDGSTDKSEQIIKSFKDKRIRYYWQPNSGVAATLEKGLKLAKYNWIRRVDADDIIHKKALEKQVEFLKKNPDVAVISTQICFMTENSKIAKKFKHPSDTIFADKPYKYVDFEDYKNRNSGLVVHATALFDKRKILEVGGYRKEFVVSEDDDLWLRVMDKYPVVILKQCLYYVRIHKTSATQTHKQKIEYFWNLAINFALERRQKGTDPLQRGEKILIPKFEQKSTQLPKPNGKVLRNDLRFFYNLTINAKDWSLAFKTAKEIFKYGWKRLDTYKLLLFPILGDRIVQFFVKLKRIFKGKK